ncbi:MAG: tryptophan 2,3-dioxygenase [Pseudomonadota bacterium]
MTEPFDPDHQGAHMQPAEMSYGDYLRLDKILSAQFPLTDAHDEMLFIVQHQASEIWMRLAIHELAAARENIQTGQMRPAFKMLTRVARIFDQLNGAWDVLRTMTPSEYTQFREDLASSSGFQSAQYREIEFLLGNRNAELLKPHANNPEEHARLHAALQQPSLYDAALHQLSKAGFDLPEEILGRDVSQRHVEAPKILDAWRVVYGNPQQYWALYELGEKLMDLEDYFRRWRFNHVTTVERIIGAKRGSGGTAGIPYLRRMLDVVLFPELWSVRTLI